MPSPWICTVTCSLSEPLAAKLIVVGPIAVKSSPAVAVPFDVW